MRILLLTQYFWPENFRINDVVSGLRERGHGVTVVTGLPNYPGGQLAEGYRGLSWLRRLEDQYNTTRVVRVPLLPRGSGRGARLFLNYVSFALSASIFAPARTRGEYDVILVYEPSPVTVGIPSAVLRRLSGRPVAFWVQDLWPESLTATGAVQSGRVLVLVERLVRWIYRRTDLLLVQSRAFEEPIARLGVPRSRIAYLPNSAEVIYRPVDPSDAREEGSVMPPGFRVVFAGNLGASQDLETVLAAAEQLRHRSDIKWILLGDGRRRAWLEEQVKVRRLEDNVSLLGQYPTERMPLFFAHADALLVSLKRDPIFALTIPSKLQSYLACAKPVIAALDGEGARVVVEAGAGIACGAQNPERLAGAVLELAAMAPEQRRAMGELGRAYFERHFEREYILDQLERMLGSLCRRSV